MSRANRITRCRSCGEQIRFETLNGKHLAVNLDGSIHKHQGEQA